MSRRQPLRRACRRAAMGLVCGGGAGRARAAILHQVIDERIHRAIVGPVDKRPVLPLLLDQSRSRQLGKMKGEGGIRHAQGRGDLACRHPGRRLPARATKQREPMPCANTPNAAIASPDCIPLSISTIVEMAGLNSGRKNYFEKNRNEGSGGDVRVSPSVIFPVAQFHARACERAGLARMLSAREMAISIWVAVKPRASVITSR